MSTEASIADLMAMAGLADEKPLNAPEQQATEPVAEESAATSDTTEPVLPSASEGATPSICLKDGTLVCPVTEARVVLVESDGKFDPHGGVSLADLVSLYHCVKKMVTLV